MKPKHLPVVLSISLILIVSLLVSCGNLDNPEKAELSAAPVSNYIKIASFNIQVFGQSKINKPEVMNLLSQIIKRYDIVAIQEIRSRKQNVIQSLLELVNDESTKYDYVISRRLGRTTSKEQYAFVYNIKTVQLIPDSDYVIEDPDDKLHREPYIATFKSNEFDFILINIHTDPDEVPEEIDELALVYQRVQDSDLDEDDVILLGDLNYGPSFSELGRIPTIKWTIEGKYTNTRNNKLYDNILYAKPTYFEYREGNVLDFESEYNLTREEALRVSDHRPIWAKFYIGGPDDD